MPASERVKRSLKLAQRLRQPWEDRWQRFVDLARPYGTHFWRKSDAPENPGTIYDETLMVSVEEFAGRLVQGIIPPGLEWARLEVRQSDAERLGQAVLNAQRELFHLLGRTNFSTEVYDAFKDLAGEGNACVRITAGDWQQPVTFEAIPLPDVWITPGPMRRTGDIHVRRHMTPDVVLATYPGAELPDGMAQKQEQIEVTDSWLRDLSQPVDAWTWETHINCTHVLASGQTKGEGSCEYVFGRWGRASGDLYGVGQGMVALPAAEVLNDAVRMILAHGELALSGMWQAEDDGVMNPWAVRLQPGNIVPIAPGSKGLQPLAMPGTKLDIGQLVLEEQRHAIRKALFAETLGAREGTPPTAMEIETRMAELARQIGSNYNRVWSEFVYPMTKRILVVMRDSGLMHPEALPGFGPTRITAASSMVRSARVHEVRRMQEWAAGLAGLFPQQFQLMVHGENWARRTAELMDIDEDMLTTEADRERIGQQLGAAMQGLGGGEEGGGAGEALKAAGPALQLLGGGKR